MMARPTLLMGGFILSLFLAACQHNAKNSNVSPDTPPTTYDDVWRDTPMNDPLAKDDPRSQNLDFYFVTAKFTSVCATKEEAMARECGNTVEFPPEGYKLNHGDIIAIVPGNHDPDSSTLPSIRFMVQGLTPAYVARDDVAKSPDLSHRTTALKAYESEFIHSHSAKTLPQRQLIELLKDPTTEGLIHISDINPDTMTSNWRSFDSSDLTGFDLQLTKGPPVVVDFPIDMDQFWFPAFMDEEYFPEVPHNYFCGKDYCDKIDLIFSKKKGYAAQLLYVIDRFGTHTLR